MPDAKLRILVVDWDKTVVQSLVLVLNAEGFEAVSASSGEEALAKAAQSGFDMLLSEVVMEPLNGVETAIAFLQLQPNARVQLFSGNNAAVSILREAAEAGRDLPVLAKPFHPDELFRILRDLQPPIDGAEPALRPVESPAGPEIPRMPES